jgi:hypothetical protein
MMLTNKAGHRPLTGPGYTFDATLGYPGEGPSHQPPTSRGVRPTLRLWSTRRPHAASVDSLRVRLHFDGNPPKTTFGNSDTRLGQWLHASRHRSKTEATTGEIPRSISVDSFQHSTTSDNITTVTPGVIVPDHGVRRRHRQDFRPSGIIAPVAPGADATEVLLSPPTASRSSTLGGGESVTGTTRVKFSCYSGGPAPEPDPKTRTTF